MVRLLSLSASSLLLLAICSSPTQVRGDVQVLSWDEAYVKAKALVGKMTLQQKVNIATGVGWANGPCVGNTYAITNPEFPQLCLQDAPVGVRGASDITAGVAGINVAASFDKTAMRNRGVYLGKEFRGKGAHVQLGPGMNMIRNPRSGRGWEGFGEDPYLAGIAAGETIQGVQSQGVIATAKHYIANDQETNRGWGTSDVDQRTLHEVYLWPFARSVEAGVGSIMCGYNMVNATFACENDYTINKVLKQELGFRGFVQSDWSATHSTVNSVNGGLDMTMPGDITFGSKDSYFGANLTKAVGAGTVKAARVNDVALRITAAWYKMRQDTNFPKTSINFFNRALAGKVDVQADHNVQVRQLGAASTVLLRNSENILPIKSSIKTIAIIGSDAGADPNGVNSCGDRGCSRGTLAQGWGSGTCDFPYLITPLDAIKKRAGKNVKLVSTLDDWNLNTAASTAKNADIAFVFSNADSGEEYLNVDGNAGDRKNMTLWHNGDNLIKAVADANKNTVVIIHSVGAVLMPWINHPNIKAIVWPGLPGQESGNSLADILFGDVNPSGRLPYTIGKKEADYSATISTEWHVPYTDKLLIGYRWFDAKKIAPNFEFGFGLSYTTFKYTNLKINSVDKGQSDVKASISVTNSGTVDGAEVVQAYIGFPASAGEPPKMLRGFEKVFLKKTGSTTVQFEFTKRELSIWDTKKDAWVTPSGQFTLYVGASSRDIRGTATFNL